MAIIGAATLKKKASKPSDLDVFGGLSLRCYFSTSDSVTTCREKLCSGAGEKEVRSIGASRFRRGGRCGNVGRAMRHG